MTALDDGSSKTLPVLERRLNDAMVEPLPRRMRRRRWNVAIDWHLQPYYGKPFQSRNEFCCGKLKQRTTKFHACASACIVECGRRYTLVLSWGRRHESMVRVLRRLVVRILEIGLKIRRVLLDRTFFNGAVVAFLQGEKVPFVMLVVIRGHRPKEGAKSTGLWWLKCQPAGWYPHVMKHEKRQLKISVCVGYRRYRTKDGKQRHQKLLFAAWRVHGSPTEIRELCRRRFGIETSFRQMRKVKIYTCTRPPPAAVLPGRSVGPAEPLGMDSSHSARRRIGRYHHGAPGTLAIQTHARQDRPRSRRPIPRRLNTLRRSTAVN